MKLEGIRLSDIEDKKKGGGGRKRQILYKFKFTYMGSKKANLRYSRMEDIRSLGMGEMEKY